MTWLVAIVVVLGVVVALAGLAVSVRRVVGLVRRPPLATLPLVDEQRFRLDASGPLVLQLEGPIGTTAFARLEATLHDEGNVRDVPLHPILLRTRSASFSRARLGWRRFALAGPSTLVLRLTGAPRDAAGDCIIVVAKPHGIALPIGIVSIVASAMLLVGGIVLAAMAVTGALDP